MDPYQVQVCKQEFQVTYEDLTLNRGDTLGKQYNLQALSAI